MKSVAWISTLLLIFMAISASVVRIRPAEGEIKPLVSYIDEKTDVYKENGRKKDFMCLYMQKAVSVDVGVLRQAMAGPREIGIPVPGSGTVTYRQQHVDTYENGYISWVGELPDTPHDRAYLTCDADGHGFYGVYTFGGRQFRIAPDPESDSFILTEVDPECDLSPDDGMDVGADVSWPAAAKKPLLSRDDGSVIDILVLYHEDWLSKYSREEMDVMVHSLISQANQTFLDSGVETRLELVHTQKIGKNCGKTMQKTLWELSQGTGAYAEAQKLREDYRADLVTLIMWCKSGCMSCEARGVGQRYGPYSIITSPENARCFIHEIGHNFGCGHEEGNKNGDEGYFEFSHGFKSKCAQAPKGKLATVMSYSGIPPQTFSNPDVSFYGCPGGSKNADNAYTINFTKENVSQFISSDSSPVNFSAGPTYGESPLTVFFNDKSRNSPFSWEWDLDGDGIIDSTEQHPSHIYETEGTYTVSLTAYGPGGTDTAVKHSYITVTGKDYLLTLNIEPPDGGIITGAGISCYSSCSEKYFSGMGVMLTAQPNEGYIFTEWNGCDSTHQRNCSVEMDADRRLSAFFQEDIDLQGRWSSMEETCVYKKNSRKCTLSGKFSLENTGSHHAKSSVILFFLSDDGVLDINDRKIKTAKTGNVKALSSKNRVYSYKLPQEESAAGRYFIALIDADDTLEETDETNNTVVFGPMPGKEE